MTFVTGHYSALQILQVWVSRSCSDIIRHLPWQGGNSTEWYTSISCHSWAHEDPSWCGGSTMGEGEKQTLIQW